MKSVLIALLLLYKRFFSPFLEILLGKACRFTPTCSEYAIDAIKKYGAIKGAKMSLLRFLRCNPRSVGGYDPVQ